MTSSAIRPAVPIHPAANPARREWLATPGAVPLVLPAGRYTVDEIPRFAQNDNVFVDKE
ncbi:MAG: hypothetical protein HY825_03635 [Acidobacteria bacterium]|nr:hypothetical protein [Acidobacteriota bacterium]